MNNQKALDDKISYGVFWKRSGNEEWTLFAGWLPFSNARNIYTGLALKLQGKENCREGRNI